MLMRCKYCNEEIEQDSVFCPNCGKKVQKESHETHERAWQERTSVPRNEPKKHNLGLWLLLLLLAILLGVIAYLLFPKSSKAKDEMILPDDRASVVDSDSIYREKAIMEQQQTEDSLMKVAKQMSDSLAYLKDSLNKIDKDKPSGSNTPASKQVTSPRRESPASSQANTRRSVSSQVGTKNLGYGSYKGGMVGGKPHGVNGRLVFKSVHQIDSRDPKGRVAEPGDYVIGEFYDGHLVQGIWYDANNQVKGSIIIGR